MMTGGDDPLEVNKLFVSAPPAGPQPDGELAIRSSPTSTPSRSASAWASREAVIRAAGGHVRRSLRTIRTCIVVEGFGPPAELRREPVPRHVDDEIEHNKRGEYDARRSRPRVRSVRSKSCDRTPWFDKRGPDRSAVGALVQMDS